MKCLLFSILILSCINCTPDKKQDLSRINAKKGYKDLVLNGPYDSLKIKNDFVLALDNQCMAVRQYEATAGDYTKIGAIQFNKVVLEYALDSLSSTLLYKQYNFEDFTALAQVYRNEFGEPTESESKKLGDSDLKSNTWSGKNIRIHLEGSSIVGIVILYSSASGLSRKFLEEQKCEDRKIKKAQTEL